jgi:hypothetical protein
LLLLLLLLPLPSPLSSSVKRKGLSSGHAHRATHAVSACSEHEVMSAQVCVHSWPHRADALNSAKVPAQWESTSVGARVGASEGASVG